MSFSNQTTGMGLKKFESEGEINEKKKKRQEEWDRVRKPEDPQECPEEVYDPRSLYEQLEAQKQKKQDDYDDQVRLRNQVKGLGEDEADFLNYVSNRQMEIEKKKHIETASILQEMKDAQLLTIPKEVPTEEKKPTIKPQVGSSQGKSQMALLAGAIKRKSVDAPEVDKKRKISDGDSEVNSTTEHKGTGEGIVSQVKNSVAHVIGVLPGLGEYDNNTSDSETSSSDSEIELKASQERIAIQASSK